MVGRHPWLFGVHIWNLCDFRAPQMHLRAGGLNHKGVFTRLREPKMAAHRLREAWAHLDRTAPPNPSRAGQNLTCPVSGEVFTAPADEDAARSPAEAQARFDAWLVITLR